MRIWQFLKWLWHQTNLSLILSITANIFLVWLGILTLETSMRPIIYFDDITPNGIYVKNSGQSSGFMKMDIIGLSVVMKNYSISNIHCGFIDKSVRATVYSGQRILHWLPFLDSLMFDSTQYIQVLKVSWTYPPLLWEIVPHISTYTDSMYWMYNKSNGAWLSFSEFHQKKYVHKIEELLKENPRYSHINNPLK